jgi:PKD repeat protein
VYTQNGVYTVTLTVTGPCGTSTYTQTITITQVGIVDADLANTLSIYPNPNDGVFTVSFEFTNAKDVRVDLTDVTGRIISSEERYGVTSYRNEVGSTDLSNGVYFVRITTVDGSAVQKIVVQR